MSPKRKKARQVALNQRFQDYRKHQLYNICGYCSTFLSENTGSWHSHVESHKDEITMCRTCHIFVRLEDRQTHIEEFHDNLSHHVKYELNASLVEIRIPLGKSFSSFWAYQPDEDVNMRRLTRAAYLKNKNGRSVGTFRISPKSHKFQWSCPICDDYQVVSFPETIGMRAYALRHLEQAHLNEMHENMPGFLECEWHQLEDDTGFEVMTLMQIARHRLKSRERSFETFYTVQLSAMENGQDFQNILEQRSNLVGQPTRFCLVCCQLVPKGSIKTHFSQSNHTELKAVSQSTAFTCVVKENGENEEETEFKFPEDLFAYNIVFKNLRQDEYKWRCPLCPNARSQTFATSIILRMFALRHIDEHHQFLFNEDFLNFEWESLKSEMRASFDIRTYSPIRYTAKGENVFNRTDPNDYVLPQQYFFLSKQQSKDTLICGFCYRSLNHAEFHLHIVLHGFGVVTRRTPALKPVVLNETVAELMGQARFIFKELGDEPHKILSIEGRRLEMKINRSNGNHFGTESFGTSEATTPAKSDAESGSRTPRRRSAMTARKLLTDTFDTLQKNLSNWKANEEESSSSSSSDDENSEDDRFEQKMEVETGNTPSSRRSRSKSRQNASASTEWQLAHSSEARQSLNKMRPAEIKSWIQQEALKRGIEYNDHSSDSSSSDESECDRDETGDHDWDNMKPKDIKKLIKQVALKRKVTMESSGSDSDN